MENVKQLFCCERMERAVSNEDNPIEYDPIFREYKIRLIFNAVACEGIDYCPWCMYKLPKGLRDMFFRIIKRDYYITDGLWNVFDNAELPDEFKSDEWWKKRGL